MTEYQHPDRLGTKLVTNTSLNTAKENATLPFGAEITAETQADTNQKFTSYDRSGATGLDYAVNRTYNSGQSRFTQVDPIGMASTRAGDPQSMNLFAYTQNNPVDFVDPSGTNLSSGGYTCYLDGFETSCNLVYTALGGGWATPDRNFDNPWWLGHWEASGREGGGDIFVPNPFLMQDDRTDCEILADVVEKTAEFVDGVDGLSAGERTSAFLFGLIANLIGSAANADGTERDLNPDSYSDLWSSRNIGNREYGATGFKEKYTDTSNQVRHFTGGLWAGYLFGPKIGRSSMNSRETESDSADTRLNALSTYLGSKLIPTPETTTGSIRDGTKKTVKATPGYRALAGQIRKRVCESPE